ncbi:ecto-ADP-ribosyltransferase 3 isoform X1 [Panthera uncia]|uniref:ecto-ADP-ribosyltransferase 3 isoform X1 n=1 Tax=Panthera uncia TaxID=29064 RepID=UPI0020FF826E|nr:ecto-ADP-ribosyltransferase 3 isoform X1 [Panthera uncia]XP_049486616.1 ecto-ADP-ribosyltransferase 3 isoform X1 [Panthera uncia]XP_049486617.1 ecto-ADP-ribosyltransferase 3 isoform X1 [Panthera uncia]
MKTGHFDMVTMLLAAVILMDIFQVKAEMLDMAENAFDDEYLKCTDRMEVKYVPQLLKEEKASHALLKAVWENAEVKWEARKTQIFLPMSFKDNHGIALMAYVSEAREQTAFYRMFNEAVRMAGLSRKEYVYDFQFKAFHFYLTKALQLLRRPCEESYKNVVYSVSRDTSFKFGGLNQARLGHFTLAYSAKPQAPDDQHILLTIHACFGVAIENFFDKESERIILIPLNEIFNVSQDGTSNNLILQSINKTCSHYECAFLGGLKAENCIENMEYSQPIYIYNPGEKNQNLEDSGTKSQETTVLPGVMSHEPTQIPGMKIPETFSLPGIKVVQLDEKPEDQSQEDIGNPTPGPVPVPVPGPKTHPSASSGKMLLPPLATFIILIIASAVNLFVAL